MKNILEKIYHRIAPQCGDELYLCSYSFYLLDKNLRDDPAEENEEEKIPGLYEKATRILYQDKDWSVQAELKAWNASLLREILFFLYEDWKGSLEKNLLQTFDVTKHYQETVLDFTSRLANLDPNSLYIDLYSLLVDIEYFYFHHFEVIEQLEKLKKFQKTLLKQKAASDFPIRRIHKEKNKVQFYLLLDKIRKTHQNVNALSSYLDDHQKTQQAWQAVANCIKLYKEILESFEKSAPLFLDNFNFLSWLHEAFPADILNEANQRLRLRKLYGNVVVHLTQATACLVDHCSFQLDSFQQRNKIINQHILAAIEGLEREETPPPDYEKGRYSTNSA